MQKSTLIKLVNSTSDYFEEFNNPQQIYLKLRSFEDFKPALRVMTGKDVMLFCFLSYEKRFLVDLSKLYDLINNEYSEFTIAEVLKQNPLKECSECNGEGSNICRECYGDGEVNCSECDGDGTIDCEECDGSGEDENGDTCELCGSTGEQKCNKCYGRGRETCSECRGKEYIECSQCDGTGEDIAINSTLVQYTRYLSYDTSYTKLFEDMEEDTILDQRFLERLNDRNKTLIIQSFDDLLDNFSYNRKYREMEEGISYFVHEKKQPQLTHNSGKISIY